MSHLPLWYLGQAPHEVCDIARAEFEQQPVQDATMGSDGKMIAHTHRNTDVRFAPTGHWFGGILLEHATQANAVTKWDYEVDSHEALQYASYGSGQHYHWHTDNFPISGQPRDRKITVVCLMNDPSEFTGGEFQLRLYQEYLAPLTKGSIIAFPSIIEHRVTPVLSGVRHSATIWLSGPRFR